MRIVPPPGSGARILIKLDSGHGGTPLKFLHMFGQHDYREQQASYAYIKLKRANQAH